MSDSLVPPLIMVVDDDDIMRVLSEDAVYAQGWRFHGEPNGLEALEALELCVPDLLIVDAHMPKMDGFELIEAIREAGINENLPILMATADDDLESINRAYDIGATGFEVKPINWPLLIHRIRHMLRSAETLEQLSQTAKAFERSQAALMRAQSVAQLGSWEWRGQRESLSWSDAASRVLGLGMNLGADALNPSIDTFAALTPPQEREQSAARLRGLLESNRAGEFTQTIIPPNGEKRVILVRAEPRPGDVVAGYFQDVTEQESNVAKIRKLAYVDPLTELPNHHCFHDALEKLLRECANDSQRIGVMYLDLDEFKRVNDTFGHAIGDAILRQVGTRLSTIVNDRVPSFRSPMSGEIHAPTARLGGDEFAVVLPALDNEDDAASLAVRIIEELSKPLLAGDAIVTLTPSIGIALGPKDGDTAGALMHNADTAMYAAKKRGNGQYCFFSQELQASARHQISVTNALRGALENDEFHLAYQPKVDIVTGRPRGAEALLRWNNAELGAISPAEFIPIAEETGLILKIGDWVLNEACRAVKRWRDAGTDLEQVAVNVSAIQFSQTGFVERITEILHEAEVPAAALELELTESLLASDANHATMILTELKALGVSLSIDDFGTGYSSLSYLKNFPVDNLKIDSSFVKDIETNPDDAAIASTIIRMAETMGLKVIAEGVETSGQLNVLKRERCDLVQGYYFARPMPEGDLAQWLIRYETEPAAAQNIAERQVLLVDDDQRLLQVSAQALRRSGFHVVTATSPAQAFEVLSNQQVAVVISDYDMGEMDGVEFLTRVAKLYPEIVRIMLSGQAEKGAVIEAVNQGAVVKYFEKPVSLMTLRGAVRDAVSRFDSLKVA